MGKRGGEGDVAPFECLLGDGVAALGDGDGWFGGGGQECRPAVAGLSSDFCEGEEAVERGEGGDGISERLILRSNGGEEVFEGFVAGRGESLSMLVALRNETDDFRGVEPRESLGAGYLAPRGRDVLDVFVGDGDEIFDACDGDVFDTLLLDFPSGDGAVLVEFVLDVGDSKLVVLDVFGMELLPEEFILVILLGGVEIDALEIRDDGV